MDLLWVECAISTKFWSADKSAYKEQDKNSSKNAMCDKALIISSKHLTSKGCETGLLRNTDLNLFYSPFYYRLTFDEIWKSYQSYNPSSTFPFFANLFDPQLLLMLLLFFNFLSTWERVKKNIETSKNNPFCILCE